MWTGWLGDSLVENEFVTSVDSTQIAKLYFIRIVVQVDSTSPCEATAFFILYSICLFVYFLMYEVAFIYINYEA